MTSPIAFVLAHLRVSVCEFGSNRDKQRSGLGRESGGEVMVVLHDCGAYPCGHLDRVTLNRWQMLESPAPGSQEP